MKGGGKWGQSKNLKAVEHIPHNLKNLARGLRQNLPSATRIRLHFNKVEIFNFLKSQTVLLSIPVIYFAKIIILFNR
jgi:hypothetical protein